jgi:hypothetical protein
MYGQHVDNLNVFIKTGVQLPATPVWTKFGTQGNAWRFAQIEMTSSANFKVRNRSTNTSGNNVINTCLFPNRSLYKVHVELVTKETSLWMISPCLTAHAPFFVSTHASLEHLYYYQQASLYSTKYIILCWNGFPVFLVRGRLGTRLLHC